MIKGEDVKHLKDLRTRAKVALGRKVNSVTKTVNTMLEEELMKEYSEVHKAATKVTEANSEYLMKLILNADSDEDQVPEELRADVEKTDGETSQRLEEVSEVIKANLWSRHGEKKVMFAIGEAEKVYEDAEATQIDLVSYENYEKQLKHLEILIKELKEVHSTWRGWAPVTARKDVEEIVRQLETRKNALKRQKEAEFNKALGAAELARTAAELERTAAELAHTAAEDERTKLAETQRAKLAEIQIAAEEARIAAEDEHAQFARVQLRQDQAQRSKLAKAQIAAEEARFDLMKAQHKAVEEAHTTGVAGTEPRDNPMGVISKIRLKPVSLPKFSGSMREFHHWKKDWESLQKQGEPSTSPEVKQFQLLDCMEEKVKNDVKLTSYSTVEDMFRVLENRYGNRSTIALQIVAELEKTPAVKGDQPRKVIDLIQAAEKALADLTDLRNPGAINHPLMNRKQAARPGEARVGHLQG